MERVNKIYRHPLYQEQFQELQELEKTRIFCNHTMEHFLDVARLMYIAHLEKGVQQDKEVIYAAALLHDIGRAEQYRKGTSHDLASAALAERILPECGFSEGEIQLIRKAIVGHRQSKEAERTAFSEKGFSEEERNMQFLSDALYKADKKSRNCFSCKAFQECNWAMEKKNMEIKD